MSRCSSPTRSSPISGSAPSTSRVTRWKPRGARPSAISRWSHIGGQSCHAHVHALAAEGHALVLEQRALAVALRQRPVGAHDAVPRQVGSSCAWSTAPGEARRARARSP